MSETLGVILGIDIAGMSAGNPPPRPPPSKPTPTKEPEPEQSMETEEPENVKNVSSCQAESELSKFSTRFTKSHLFQALEEKVLGNEFYKKKEFEKAIEHYDRAIELDETNITFYTNKAAVFFEQAEYEKCRETCLKGIDIGRDHRADYKLVAK